MPDTTNLQKLNAFVDGHIAIAARKTPAEADAHLMGWAGWLDAQAAKLGCADTPAHLVGLTAFDIADARDRLAAAAVGYSLKAVA